MAGVAVDASHRSVRERFSSAGKLAGKATSGEVHPWNVVHACTQVRDILPLIDVQVSAGMRPFLVTPHGSGTPDLYLRAAEEKRKAGLASHRLERRAPMATQPIRSRPRSIRRDRALAFFCFRDGSGAQLWRRRIRPAWLRGRAGDGGWAMRGRFVAGAVLPCRRAVHFGARLSHHHP